MSVADPSVALSGGGLTLPDQASAIFGPPAAKGYPSEAQLNDAAYLELTGVANVATVQQVNVSEPPNLAAAAALMSQLTAAIQSRSDSAAAALQVLSAATTLTMTAD
jgi:hypothetical protein